MNEYHDVSDILFAMVSYAGRLTRRPPTEIEI